MLNRFISSYFGFNRQQRNGLWVLLLISFILLLIRLLYPLLMEPAQIVIRDLPLIERRLDSSDKTLGIRERKDDKLVGKKQHLFMFDPNTVSMVQLVQLGFREKTAATLLKFRGKGGRFRDKKDLLKVFGVSASLYTRLEPYMVIAATDHSLQLIQTAGNGPHTATSGVATAVPFELNTADSAQLMTLNGIGAGYTKRILKYRDLLGGFVNSEQLKEVYGFTAELYEKIRPKLTVDAQLIKKINLNRDDFRTINKHPYLSYALTKTIFDWRRKTTINPVNLKDILNDEVLYHKLLPYLSFD